MAVSEAGVAFNDALSRLTKYLGAGDAVEVMAQALRLARTAGHPETPDDLYRIGVMLEEHDLPAVQSIGVGMKVKALLLGAQGP